MSVCGVLLPTGTAFIFNIILGPCRRAPTLWAILVFLVFRTSGSFGYRFFNFPFSSNISFTTEGVLMTVWATFYVRMSDYPADSDTSSTLTFYLSVLVATTTVFSPLSSYPMSRTMARDMTTMTTFLFFISLPTCFRILPNV